jgi:hypothetical protein
MTKLAGTACTPHAAERRPSASFTTGKCTPCAARYLPTSAALPLCIATVIVFGWSCAMASMVPCSVRQIEHQVAQNCTSTGCAGLAGRVYAAPSSFMPDSGGGVPLAMSRCCQARMHAISTINSSRSVARLRQTLRREVLSVGEDNVKPWRLNRLSNHIESRTNCPRTILRIESITMKQCASSQPATRYSVK